MENWVVKRARLTGERIGLRCEGRAWTFAQMADEVAERARRLQPLDVGRIAFLCANSADFYFWILAAHSVGAQTVLLNTRLSPTEIAAQLAVADCDLVLCDLDLQERLGSVDSRTLAQAAEFTADDAWRPVDVDLDAVASIMFTSGTTGAPKGVMQSFGNHWWSATGSMLNLGLEPERDAWICAVSLFHISGLSIVMRGLIYGIAVELYPRFDVAAVNESLLSGRATTISVVTVMLRALLDDLGDRRYPATLRCVLLGGGFVDDQTLARCRELGLPVVFSFGMTETASQVVAMPLAEIERKPGSAGLPHLTVDLRIDAPDDDGIGEIQIQSPTIAVGYVGRDDAYAQAFTPDGWFRTGDLGRLDDDGYLYVVARLSELIISGGENVLPSEVERALQAHPSVREAAVVGRDDDRWGQVPVAFVVPQSGATIDVDALRACARERLAAYKVPAEIIVVDDLPRTATGKILRRALLG